MQQPVEAPTPEALADLVRRCKQIDRFATQLTAAEESRVAALASGILAMRGVLELPAIEPDKLPQRQRLMQHWSLTDDGMDHLLTAPMRHLHGCLVLDEHEQVKILSHRTWRGGWRNVTLWHDGVHGVSAHDLMEYLVALTTAAQERAPETARALLERAKAIAATSELSPRGPRSRAD